jgi:hypothetical protein
LSAGCTIIKLIEISTINIREVKEDIELTKTKESMEILFLEI